MTPLHPSSLSDSPFLPGRLLAGGRYIVDHLLAQGGMGVLLLASDTSVAERLVVIKLLRPYFDRADPQQALAALRRFEREAESLAALSHPAVPALLDRFEEAGTPCLVLEYLPGENLLAALSHSDGVSNQVQAGSPNALFELLRWGVALCNALHYLHTRQPPLLHLDIKPENIVADRASDRICLVDFGAARPLPAAAEPVAPPIGPPSVYGTPGYAPPEQYRGQPEARSDVYALAATLYHLASGDDPSQHPLQFPQLDQLGELGSLLRAALAQEPAERPDAATFGAALATLLPATSALLRAPDGTMLATAVALAHWCENHPTQAVGWLHTGLPERVAQWWGAEQLAAELRAILAARTEPLGALDGALALLDPHGYGASETTLEVSAAAINFRTLTPGVGAVETVQFHNQGRRIAHLQVEAPAWLTVTPAQLVIAAGAQARVSLRTNAPALAKPGRLRGTLSLVADGETLLQLPVRARVLRPWQVRWRQLPLLMRMAGALACCVLLWLSYGFVLELPSTVQMMQAQAARDRGDWQAACSLYATLDRTAFEEKRTSSCYTAGRQAFSNQAWSAAREAWREVDVAYSDVAQRLDTLAYRDGRAFAQLTFNNLAKTYSASATNLVFGPDSRLVAAARQETFVVWQSVSAARLQALADRPYDQEIVAISPDGSTLLIATAQGLQVWDGLQGRASHTLALRNQLDSELMADGQWLRLLRVEGLRVVVDERSMVDGTLRASITLPANVDAKSAVLGAGGLVVASRETPSMLVVRRVSDGAQIGVAYAPPVQGVHGTAVSADGSRVLLRCDWCSQANEARLYRASDGALIQTIAHDVPFAAVALSPNGQTIATGTEAGSVLLWRAVP